VTDRIGHCCVFGVIASSANTTKRSEYDDPRPAGVTNPFAFLAVQAGPVRVSTYRAGLYVRAIADRVAGSGILVREH
jgi:hypothetical protein